MLNNVIRSAIFDEFSPEEQEYWFSIKEKAVSHHIDTLYYSVFIEHDTVEKDTSGFSDLFYTGIGNFLVDLYNARAKLEEHPEDEIRFKDLLVCRGGAAVAGGMYGYHLASGDAKESDYDIFITKYLPNDDTPRILVQIRTRSLILDGLFGAVEKSYEKVVEILSAYGLSVAKVQENRIDYAFHTNCIQKPSTMFSDESLMKHLCTTFRDMSKHSWITAKKYGFFDLDYCALGSRRSNSLFFRAYEKTKEVIQKNYKGFFFEMWLDRGLISRYDFEVYKTAFTYGTYKTGRLIGRIDWYLEHGKNESLKNDLQKLKKSCNINSDNNRRIENEIKGVLPDPTLIMNIEYETKRKYYLNFEKSLSQSSFPFSNEYRKYCSRHRALEGLYNILYLRRDFINDLTSERVCFLKDNDEVNTDYMDWWERVKRVRIEDQPDKAKLELYRHSAEALEGARASRNLLANVSTVAMYHRNSIEAASFGEDIWDALTSLNDNDLVDEESTYKAFFSKLNIRAYTDIRKKKARQLKNIINKKVQREEQQNKVIEESLPVSDWNKKHFEPINIRVPVDVAECSTCGSKVPIPSLVIYYGTIGGKKKGLCEACSKKQIEEKR